MSANYYRARAEQVRAEALRTKNPAERDILLEIAAMYGQLAEAAEDSEKHPPKPE